MPTRAKPARVGHPLVIEVWITWATRDSTWNNMLTNVQGFCQGTKMNNSRSTSRVIDKLIRILIAINFALFVLLISPVGSSRHLYETIRAAGFAALVTTAVPLWVGGTTVVATALFFWQEIKKRTEVQPPRQVTLNGVLLLAWWIVFILDCLYAFMMGHGG